MFQFHETLLLKKKSGMGLIKVDFFSSVYFSQTGSIHDAQICLKMVILLLQPSQCQHVWLTAGMLSAVRWAHALNLHQSPTASGYSDHPCFLAWLCGLAQISANALF